MSRLERAELIRHVERWSAHASMRGREWVPRFLYHFTDLRNAVGIVKNSCIFPRETAISRGLMANDNASESVIASTRDEARAKARLYFRPRTPTQYRNEGTRSPQELEMGAHCPVPVFFLFDFVGVLSQPGVEFSDGGLGTSRARIGASRSLFESIPFQLVYHDAAVDRSERDEVVFRRHAEVLVAEGLGLDNHLKYIVCRSDAERRTLAELANPSIARWRDKLVTAERQLFFFRGSFCETVQSQGSLLTIVFRLSSHAWIVGAPVSIDVEELGTARRWAVQRVQTEPRLEVHLGGSPGASKVTVRLFGELAFCGQLDFEHDIPF